MASIHSTIETKAYAQLPFTGRTEELERLESYCQSAQDAQGLRIALLIGEAGIGKSRLLEELMQKIDNERGAVIHIKLRPGATTSILPLLTERITESEQGHKSILQKSVGTMSSVIAALQRICRLYPTVLIIEDIHLLNGDTFQEFCQLLDSLSDEFMSIICASRPMDIAVRGVLERYLVEELQLKGLEVNELEAMWNSVFGSAMDKQFSASIMRITHGNPLAIRAAIRYSLSNQGKSIAGSATNLSSSFIRGIENVTQLLAEGLAGYLTAEERRAASALACLGEVFSRETAMAFQPAIQDPLEQLIIKGIVLPTTTATSPLPGSNHTNSRPLAFTHSLVHNYFLSQATVDSDRLLRIIASEQELFSTIPVELLTQAVVGLTVRVDEAIRCIEHCLRIGHLLRETADWQLAHRYCACVSGIIERYKQQLPVDQHRKYQIQYLELDAWLLSHHDSANNEVIRSHILEQLALSENPDTEEAASLRLIALRQWYWLLQESDVQKSQEVIESIDRIVNEFPNLRYSAPYTRYLYFISHRLGQQGSWIQLKRVKSEVESVLQSPQLPSDLASFLNNRTYPELLVLFDSVEEEERNLWLLDRYQTNADLCGPEFQFIRLYLYTVSGRVTEAVSIGPEVIETFHTLGNYSGYEFKSKLYLLIALSALEPNLDGLISEAQKVCSEAPDWADAWNYAGKRLYAVGILRGDDQCTINVLDTFLNSDIQLLPPDCLLIHLFHPDETGSLKSCENVRTVLETYRLEYADDRHVNLFNLGQAVVNNDVERAITTALMLLRAPALRTDDLLILRAVVCMILWWTEDNPEVLNQIEHDLYPDIRASFGKSVDWLVQRGLHCYIEPLLDLYGQRFLDPEHIQALQQKVSDLRNRHIETVSNHPTEKSNRLGITMLGTISICKPGAEPEKIRGNRIRMLLGAMVANHMLGYTLDHNTFCKIACSEEVYRESARKNLNSAVYRLREFMGHDAVCLINNIPRLNLDFVAVDLIEGCSHLKSAKRATQAGDFSKASEQLLLAMRIFRSEVAFPALYEEFFENQREKLELELRSVVLMIAKSLVRDQKLVDAERLLEHAMVCLQDDEELEEMGEEVKRMNRISNPNP